MGGRRARRFSSSKRFSQSTSLVSTRGSFSALRTSNSGTLSNPWMLFQVGRLLSVIFFLQDAMYEVKSMGQPVLFNVVVAAANAIVVRYFAQLDVVHGNVECSWDKSVDARY